MILFLDLVVLAIIISIVLFFATQILIPLFNGTPFFPLLRAKSTVAEATDEAEKTLEMLSEAEDLQEALEEIDRRKSNLKGN